MKGAISTIFPGDNATCTQACSNPTCTATFSGGAVGAGNCSLSISFESTYTLVAPQPRQIVESFSKSIGMACIQLDGAFCFPQYTNASRQLFGGDGPAAVGQAVLERFCTPCTSRIMDYIGLSAESDRAFGLYMDMLCTRAGPSFCYPSFTAITSSGPGAALTLEEQEAAMCKDACVPSVFMKFDNYLQQPSPGAGEPGPTGSPQPQYGRAIEALCSNDGSADNHGGGKSCLQAMGWSVFGGVGPPPLFANLSAACNVPMGGDGPPAPPAACGAACAGAFGRLASAWGCCLRSFSSALGPRMGVLPFLEGTRARCAAPPLRPECGVSRLAPARGLCVGMPNLDYAYYAARRADVTAAVALSVALYTGVPSARVRVASDGRVAGLGGAGNGTVVCMEVQSCSPEQSAAVQRLIDGIGAGGPSARRAGDDSDGTALR
jgi:hypothetical protein